MIDSYTVAVIEETTVFPTFIQRWYYISLLCRGFNTAKIKAREASARFLTQYGVEPGGGGGDGVIQTIFQECDTENDI